MILVLCSTKVQRTRTKSEQAFKVLFTQKEHSKKDGRNISVAYNYLSIVCKTVVEETILNFEELQEDRGSVDEGGCHYRSMQGPVGENNMNQQANSR